ncbi:MAG: sulfite exporter TauE/SafE family protein [Deltaproteobacteria bacterium]|nr:sulfite exporter TauE/SafE family protein [Deltaproteobacteria bacterium]
MNDVFEILTRGTDLSLSGFWVLCTVSFLGSFTAAALGLGGGILVLATMAQLLPPTVLVPIHGVVQLGSNLGRALLLLRHTLTAIVPPFLAGTLVGAALGAQFVITLPKQWLQIVLAIFILTTTWAPQFQSGSTGKVKFIVVGALTTIISMFVGGTGALVGAFVSPACADRRQFVSTHAVVMAIQHAFKVIAFGILGFAFSHYIPLLLGLVLFGFLGSYAGRSVLNRLPERVFRVGLKTILTLLGLRLLFTALSGGAG